MKAACALVLCALTLVAPASAQDEPTEQETLLLDRWDALGTELKLVKSELGDLQIRYNGTESQEGRDALEKTYNKLCADFISKVNGHLKTVAEFLEKNPKSRVIRERRAMDEVFTWANPEERAKDCEILFEETKSKSFMEQCAKLYELAYRPAACARAWQKVIEVAPDVEAHYQHGTALMNALKFKEARATFEAGLVHAKDDKDKKKLTGAAEFANQYIQDWPREQKLREESRKKNDLPVAEIKTDRGTMVLELFEDQAPNTVANFIVLAEQGFFDDGIFHRCIANFMIQGGDPMGTGMGGPGYNIKDECKGANIRLHYPGSLSMAKNAGQDDSGGSQFFVTSGVTGPLNGRHTVFGRVLKGVELTHVKPIDVSKVSFPFKIISVKILKKRDHEYKVEKLTN